MRNRSGRRVLLNEFIKPKANMKYKWEVMLWDL